MGKEEKNKNSQEREPALVTGGESELCSICHKPDCKHKDSEITPLLPGEKPKASEQEFEDAEEEDDDEDTITIKVSFNAEEKDTPHFRPPSNWELQPNQKEIFARSPEDLLGFTLANKYALLSLIGKGGMSAVYSAKDLKLNKVLAVKLLLPHLASQQINAKRFQMEAQAASSLYHPNLITTHDYGVTVDGIPFIAMDLVEGKSLSDILKEEGKLDIKRAISIFIQIADALAHAHGKNVLHRDLKPSNVMITKTGSQFEFVKLVDFGIAKMIPKADEDSIDLTRTGEIFGSPQYMSPEQCSSGDVDSRSDIYSMGCLMYEVLAGKPPFHQENIMEVLFSQINDSPPDFNKVAPEVEIPQQLQLILFKCLAKNPRDRYQSAEELSERLNQFSQTATEYFIKQVQAKWQVFKLKSQPLKKREKNYLILAVVALSLLAFAGLRILNSYTNDVSILKQLKTSQAFMPLSLPEERMPTDKMILARAMEAGIDKRLTRLKPDDSRAEILKLILDLENVANTYMHYKQYAIAGKYYKATEDLYDRYGDTNNKNFSRLNLDYTIGECYYAEGKYVEAIPYFKIFIANLSSMGIGKKDMAKIIEALIYKGTAEYATGDYESAERDFRKVFRLLPETGTKLTYKQLSLLKSQLADCLRLENKHLKAAQIYKDAESDYLQIPNLKTSGDTIYNARYVLAKYFRAYCYYMLKDLKKADSLFEELLPELKVLSGRFKNLRVTATAQYADLLWREGNYIKSIEMANRAKDLKKFLLD